MTKVPANRAVERIAVNETRALLERHGHIVQEVDGGSDYGEDLYVSFVDGGRRTGDLIAVQIKGGTSFRRATGYGVSTRKHADDWRRSNVPVLCVVYDPEMKALYWGNATRQLREAKADGVALKSIAIGEQDVLNDKTVHEFVRDTRRYLEISGSREREEFKAKVRLLSSVRDSLVLKDAPVGGHPNVYFERLALGMERNPKLVLWGIGVLLLLVGCVFLTVMWPTLWWFAETYSTVSPWMWMTSLYSFTVLCAGLALYETRLGRKSLILRLMSYGPLCVTYWVAAGTHYFHWKLSTPLLQGVADAMPGLLKNVLFIMFATYIGREIIRRRRVKALTQSGGGTGAKDGAVS
ncbi:DUF4365 domain-containing protein [Streptomyces sp. NPDC002790]|uniref:DUF4365 domain-containing protein n=1 Tax=Streptomyces sp. NPDC002790 TaxID=3154431 RepID=UPI00332430E4